MGDEELQPSFFDDGFDVIDPVVAAGLRAHLEAWLLAAAETGALETVMREEEAAWTKLMDGEERALTARESVLDRFDTIVPDVESEWRIPKLLRHHARRLRELRCLLGTPLEVEVTLAADFYLVEETGIAAELLGFLESAALIAKFDA